MPPRDTPELPEGLNLLERYTIIDRVAAGGMADIYRAHDSRLDRIVCVKLLRNVIEGSGSGGIIYQATYTHFLQEARALSKLAHPNTLRIYDFGFLQDTTTRDSGEFASRPFQISEYLDGGNLETYVRARGALRPVEVLAIVDRIAGAIAEAHGAGIIHRDIKPSNILFSRVGEVLMPKLADFGIARRARKVLAGAESGGPTPADDSSQTMPPVPLFSPRWAAPEQLSASDEGPFTDVYALGLVVAFMLAGQGLFEVPKIDSTYNDRVSGDAFVRSRLAMHTFTPEVARALMGALRADPRVRTQSPFELYEGLSVAFGTPRATLPTVVSHSGGVPSIPPPRARQGSISVEVAFKGSPGDPQSIEPPEQWLEVDGRKVRLVETHEKLDLSYASEPGHDVRFRVTLLPARGSQFTVNFKGLSCFIGKPGGAASPALVADSDGAADLVSARKERLGGLAWTFGALRGTPGGMTRVFPVARGELVVPFPHGERAIMVELAPEREVIVICRRA
jgi:eukaryotic-like serine/threonine-protein kinase